MSAMFATQIVWVHKLRNGNCRMVLYGDRGRRELDMPVHLLHSFAEVRGWLFKQSDTILSSQLRRGWDRYIADCMIYCDLNEPCEVCESGPVDE